MAQFNWRRSEITGNTNDVDFTIEGATECSDWVVLETISVFNDQMCGVHITLEFDYITEAGDMVGCLMDEDPEEYDEEAKENFRSLLRHLGYKRGPVWTWKRP